MDNEELSLACNIHEVWTNAGIPSKVGCQCELILRRLRYVEAPTTNMDLTTNGDPTLATTAPRRAKQWLSSPPSINSIHHCLTPKKQNELSDVFDTAQPGVAAGLDVASDYARRLLSSA